MEGGRAFLGVIWVSSGDGRLSQTPRFQGSHFARASWGLAGSISWRFLATFSTNFISETPGTTVSPVTSFLAQSVGNQPGEAPRGAKRPGEGTEEGGGHTAQSFPNPLVDPHSLPGLSHPLHPLHPQPKRFMPELTAWRCTERVKQKWKQKAKTGLGTPHPGLCHPQPNSSGMPDCLLEVGII